MKLIVKLIFVAVLLVPQAVSALCVQGDCISGQGTVVLSDGRKYVGEFKDGVRTGRGLMTFPDGTKYLGDWLNDKPNGQGTLTSVGKFEYAGDFNNGVRHGQGTLEAVDGKKYVGQWQNDVPHGRGKITYPDGGEFVGQFENGRRNGEGEATYPDGTIYTGWWKDDLPNGQGTKIFPDGREYTGEFRNGLMHGKGTVLMPDGSRFIGQWQGDVLVRKEEIVEEPEIITAEETHVAESMDTKGIAAAEEVQVVIAEETDVIAVDEPGGHVIAVIEEKPAEEAVQEAPAGKIMVETAVDSQAVNIENSNSDFASVKQNGVFVRSGPSTEYRVINSAYKGVPVQKIDSQENWSKVKDYMGQEGWIYTPLLGNNNSAVVTATKANLRSGPGLTFNVASQAGYGTVVFLMNIKDDWYQVITPGGVVGWLSSGLVWPAGHVVSGSPVEFDPVAEVMEPPRAEKVVTEKKVSVTVVPVSEEDSSSLEVTSRERDDVMVAETVAVQEDLMPAAAAEDVRVETQPAEMAVMSEPESAPVNMITQEDIQVQADLASVRQNGRGANIRSAPSLSSEVLRSVQPGYPLAIVERKGEWVHVEDFRARRGWVYTTLLSDYGTVVVKVGKGNLRSEPSTASEIVAKLDYGMVMLLDETRGDWFRVSHPEGPAGWLHKDVVWPQ